MKPEAYLHNLLCIVWVALLSLLTLPSVAHEQSQADNSALSHDNYDSYLAAQAEARAMAFPYFLDHLQQDFGDYVKHLSQSLLPEFINYAHAANDNPAVDGQWSPKVNWPFGFLSAANLPDGRILAWGANEPKLFTGGNYTYASTWDPKTNTFVSVNHPSHSMFCGMPVLLEDGRVFVVGGDSNSSTSVKMASIFDPKAGVNKWARTGDLSIGRWYNGSVAMPNGQVFSALGSGAFGQNYPEIWSPSTGVWTTLNGANLKSVASYARVGGALPIDEPMNWLPHMHLAANGQIFHSGHHPQMNFISTEGSGSFTPVGLKNTWDTANSPSAFINEGLLMQVGGRFYDNPTTTTVNEAWSATKQAALIDLHTNIPAKRATGGMNYARIFHNLVILPNGEVMVIGGNTNGYKFDDSTTQNIPEIWSPATNTWRTIAAHAVPRNYHSVALLMTDGRVWAGGGGVCRTCGAAAAIHHPDAEVYSPSYLFKADGTSILDADRPQISAAPTTVAYGQTIKVFASSGVSRFTMIKMSATTHTANSDLRFLEVPFVSMVEGEYSLTLHTNRNVMTPGYWMLFALDAKGIPSVAKVFKVSTSDAPEITTPADQTSVVNTSVSFAIQAEDPNGDALTYDAVGLPLGLTINPSSGVISGLPTSVGSSRVVVLASDGKNTASASFVWSVVPNQIPKVSTIFGSASGTTFTDPVGADDVLTSVNIEAGTLVNSIQGVLSTGPLPIHGSTGGTLTNVAWPADEYLVRIYGVTGTSVGTISFETNKGRILGPYGTATNIGSTTSFDYRVPSGYEVIGFTGRASTSLNAIGVLYQFRQYKNQPPVINPIINQVNNLGDTVNLPVVASDPDNDPITFSATGLPTGLTINASTGMIVGAPTNVGTFDTVIKVTDAKGGSSALNFLWSVLSVDLTINPISTQPQKVNVSIPFTALVVGGSGIRYKWTFGDNTADTAYSTNPAVNHTYTKPGIYTVKVTAIDNSGATGSRTVSQAIYLAQTATKPNATGNIMVTRDGYWLWVVNQDNDSVSVFNAVTDPYAKVAEITVGVAPRSIAQAPNGQIWVTNKQSASISVIDPLTLAVVKTINMPFASQPFGIAFAPNGLAAYVTLEATGYLLKLDPATGAQIGSALSVGVNPRHFSITADSAKVLVSKYITRPLPGENTAVVSTPTTNGGEVLVVNPATTPMAVSKVIILRHSNVADTFVSGAGIPNYLNVPAISPDGLTAWLPSKQDNIKRGILRNKSDINFQNTVRGVVSNINLTTLAEVPSKRLDIDNTGIVTAAIYDQSGSYLFVALEATREVVTLDAYTGGVINRINVGRAPDGLTLSADGKKVFVNNFMDRTVSVIDITDMLKGSNVVPVVSSVLNAVAIEKLAVNVLLGKKHFYDAKDTRLARDGYLSCAVCHNDGGHDGRVWDLTGKGEGLRNTISLRGRAGAGQGLLHWSANFDEVQDFEGQIRNLAEGTGLMSDTDFTAAQAPLGAPKAGKSADLDALAAYLGSLKTFSASPLRNANGTLTANAVAGKAVFISAGCAQCHGGTPFTDSPSRVLHNVGTIKQPTSGKRLNGDLTGLDTPTLRDVWQTAPYLHDGSALTISAAITAHAGVSLTATQLSQVATFVGQIGSTEPAIVVNTPPTVAITAPVANATVSGSVVTVTATASDTNGIAGVKFQLDGVGIGVEDTVAPYSSTWDSTSVANGAHVLTAIARDTLGSTAASQTVTINVVNNVTSLPDVVITSLTYSNGIFTAQVKNEGSAATPTGVPIGISYYVDDVYKTWGTTKGSIAAGASATFLTQGGAYFIPSGSHTIKAWVDSQNRFVELNETNNTKTVAITVS